MAHPNIIVSDDEITALPDDGHWIIATGPADLGRAWRRPSQAETGAEALAFFDAIAPIVYFDSIDMSRRLDAVALRQGRDRGRAHRLHQLPDGPSDQYEAFIDALLAADKTEFKEGETAGYFDGCLPIEVMAERGRETLRFGPMKPVGLTNPHQPDVKALCRGAAAPRQRAGHALQYRRLPDQDEVRRANRCFRMIPGLENASFARLGGIHRNTFLNSPTLLDAADAAALDARISALPGQITGVEGYVEMRRHGAAGRAPGRGRDAGPARCRPSPPDTAMGALVTHITGGAEAKTFQPMNVNFGLFPPVDGQGRTARPQGPLQGLYRPRQGRLDRLAGASRHWTPPDRERLALAAMTERVPDKAYEPPRGRRARASFMTTGPPATTPRSRTTAMPRPARAPRRWPRV